jgi:hypothetical protein
MTTWLVERELWVGDRVLVYEDPVTMAREEGVAQVVEILDQRAGMTRALVAFGGSAELVERKIAAPYRIEREEDRLPGRGGEEDGGMKTGEVRVPNWFLHLCGSARRRGSAEAWGNVGFQFARSAAEMLVGYTNEAEVRACAVACHAALQVPDEKGKRQAVTAWLRQFCPQIVQLFPAEFLDEVVDGFIEEPEQLGGGPFDEYLDLQEDGGEAAVAEETGDMSR